MLQLLQFCWYYYDSETGLYYLKARYYSPDLGRFVTKDTFKGFNNDPQSLNLYAYANGNPVMNVDPDGHFIIPVEITAAGLGAGLGAIIGIITYFQDYPSKKVNYGILTRYVLRNAAIGMFGAVTFSGIAPGWISGAILGAVDYFASTPPQNRSIRGLINSINWGVIGGFIGGKYFPNTPVGKALNKFFYTVSKIMKK